MNQAADDRAAEGAQAKLARIEKIVDLDASSPEELQPSYVGKMIVQCPQCMTLFYKDEADLNYSDEDLLTVNVGETCQHCGNNSGYSLIGKVDAAEPTVEEESVEATTEETVEEEPAEEPTAEETEVNEESAEEATEEPVDDTESIDLAAVEIPEETEDTEEEEVTESLNEDLDSDMKEYNDYIQYLKNMLAQDEEALEKAKKMKDNEFAIAVIEKRIAADKEDLEAALPKIIKEKTDELPAADETSAKDLTDNEAAEEEVTDESLNNTENASENKTEEASTEKTLQEARTKKQYST